MEADSNGIYASFLKQYNLKPMQHCYFYFSFNRSVEKLLSRLKHEPLHTLDGYVCTAVYTVKRVNLGCEIEFI